MNRLEIRFIGQNHAGFGHPGMMQGVITQEDGIVGVRHNVVGESGFLGVGGGRTTGPDVDVLLKTEV